MASTAEPKTAMHGGKEAHSPYTPIHKMRNLEEDDCDDISQWSLQVNVSSPIAVAAADQQPDDYCSDQDDNDNDEEEEEEEEEYSGEDEKYSDLCHGLSGIRLQEEEGQQGLPVFQGTHTRFVYNSDDDDDVQAVQVKVQDEAEDEDTVSPGVIRLKGLPTPEGKHLRFEEDNDTE